MVNGCTEAIHCSVADAYRSLALAVFGTGARDKMQLAEMSVAETNTFLVCWQNLL
jgi:hypothetical protein